MILSERWLYISICSLISFASIFLIISLMKIFYQHKSLIKISVNIFMINLVILDLFKCITLLPMFSYSIYTMYPISVSEYTHGYENTYCYTEAFLSLGIEIAQYLSFVAISYERFKIILSPHLNSTKRLLMAKVLLAMSWILSLAISLTLLLLLIFLQNEESHNKEIEVCDLHLYHRFSFDYLDYSNGTTNSSLHYVYDFANIYDYTYIFMYVACFLLSTYFYTRIIHFLKLHEKRISHNGTNEITLGSQSDLTQRNNVLRTLGLKNNKVSAHSQNSLNETAIHPDPISVVQSSCDATISIQPQQYSRQQQKQANHFSNNKRSAARTIEVQPRPTFSIRQVSVVVVHDLNRQMVIAKRNLNNVQGDICVLNANTTNREVGKRNLEVRTAKRTFIIMISFFLFRLFGILPIIVAQIYGLTNTNSDTVLNYIDICFNLVSFLSCFFNTFTFIIVNDLFKKEFQTTCLYFKNIFFRNSKM